MDLISHGLVGAMMAGLGLQEKFGTVGLATMVIANIAPDLDVVTCLKGPKAFYKYHREVTHSLLGASVLWILITLGIYLFTPLNNLILVGAMVGAGLCGHLLLDSLTPWGLPLFYPFKNKKYGFDLIWFFDPVMISFMAGGTLLAFRYPVYEKAMYIGSFAGILLYLLLRVSQKGRALKLAEEQVTPKFKGGEVFILPSAVSPFLWDVIYSARSQYLYIGVDTRRREVIKLCEFTSSPYHKCVKNSCQSDLVEVFLKRARFPFYSVTRDEGCYRVDWFDAQLLNLGGVHGVAVHLNEDGQITGEKLHIKKPVRRRKKRIAELLPEEG